MGGDDFTNAVNTLGLSEYLHKEYLHEVFT